MVKSDDELVEIFLSGQESAFVELVKKYNNDIYRVIYGLIHDREDAFDLTQDVFLKVYNSLPRYKANGKFFAWMYRIAQNMARNYLRRKKIAIFFSLDWISVKSPAAMIDNRDSSDIEILLEQKELKDMLDQAMDGLDNNAREILVLKEIKMLEYKEIACLLDIEIGTVKSRISRAREKLKKQLVKRGAQKWI